MLPIRVSVLSALLGLSTLALTAQGWDAARQARSWAKQDKDDSFTFFDPATRTLHTWSRDGGILASIPTAKIDGPPERWAIDPRNNAWIAHGTDLTQLDRNGRNVTSSRLPAEVGDICWDPKGLVLSYRASEPYLEKRDFKGSVLWTFGAKPAKGDGPAPQNRRTIVMDDSGKILMADGNTLNLSILDGETGRKLSETNFRLPGGQPAPLLEGSALERDALAIWPGKGVVFAAVKASQIPAALRETFQGLVLARLDLVQSRLEFIPTGLDEGHLLVGVLDADAVFVSPRGGLMLVKVK
ncbi:MAG: hypothetical protein H6P99_1806 [Holophagaceae bacterium]|nr:hypothetical protein [Holophagaceae bacterium]